MDKNSNILIASARLTTFLQDALSLSLETIRIARTAHTLLAAGVSIPENLLQRLIVFFRERQRTDGGWSDPEETAWVVGFIKTLRGIDNPSVQSALEWLNDERKAEGGWGAHSRDHARIRSTALISVLAPEVIRPEDTKWLLNEWRKDFAGPVRLSYKAGFFLLAMPPELDDELIDKTIRHLAGDQNEDGGFAPWKGHPIGSDPWSTGVVLWGLSRWGERVDRIVLKRALEWLQRTQLPSGYWPYHYLDDGASIALIGALSAMKTLAEN